MYSGGFARHYDRLTANVDYPARAKYFDGLIRKFSSREGNILLDLACGTGSLSWEFAKRGYQVIGVDASPEMLAAGSAKSDRFSGIAPPLFLCQPMEELDLYGTVDACVCALDSLNHLPDLPALAAVFRRVSLFLAPGGVFLFDLNTRYKHRKILRSNTFVYEYESLLCLWRNRYYPKHDRVEVMLDFFERTQSGHYCRDCEVFSERIFTGRQVVSALRGAGLGLFAVYDGDTLRRPHPRSQRIVYAAGKLYQKMSNPRG
ncbi:MAG: class I SAM-dependent methyltransferase [Oscillospiraceae bacterium]|nr:class I SAM-dependent methyltransferase [Oscillospiraceae bacterium]